MTIFKSNPSRWTLPSFSSTHVVFFLLLQNLRNVVGQADDGLADPKPPAGPGFNVPIAILIIVLLIAFLIIGFISVFFQHSVNETLPTAADTAMRDGGGRSRTGARGLDAAVIESFPTFLYSEVKGLKTGNGALECAVCLNEFEDRATLRLMPQCSHVFHPECIDVWLFSHSTCPVCRANLVPKPGESFPCTTLEIPEPEGETNNAERRVSESPDASLTNSGSCSSRNRPPRSWSTGLPGWPTTRLEPRSHSTGHSLVQPGENLDRFTLRIPDEVRSRLMKVASTSNRTKSRTIFSQARSSRRGYRSGSVAIERSVFSHEGFDHRRAFSLAAPFLTRTVSVRSTNAGGGEDETANSQPKGFLGNIKSPFDCLFQGKDATGERSSDWLRGDTQV